MPHPLPAVIISRCLCLGTEIANSPCSWCAGNMSPPRLAPGDRRHLLGPSTPRSHRCRCGRASLCGHGHGGRVRACHVVRARARHACDPFASPAADAPSRARRLCRADARSSGEGAARPRLCADEAGESWSVGPGASRLHVPLIVACGCSGVLTRPAVRCVGGGFRPRSHRRRLQTESTWQLEVCPTEFAQQNKTAV
jgi:hypothetical protein